jgi:glutamine amidotransferase
MARTVALLDLGVGNLHSVERALTHAAGACKRAVRVQRCLSPEELLKADAIVAPGQGGFSSGAAALGGGLGDALKQALARGTPYFGICLGLQLLFEGSEESPNDRGLGHFSGTVAALDRSGVKIPHMGWNQVEPVGPLHPYLAALGGAGAWAYFIHSYHAETADAVVVATASHGANIVTAAVHRDNVFATQFHPEKSQAGGLSMLAAFLEDPR